MITDVSGLKYGYNIADLNKTAPQTPYSRLTKQAENTQLDDNQIIIKTTGARKQNEYKHPENQCKDEIMKKIFEAFENLETLETSAKTDKNKKNQNDGFEKNGDLPECECETCKRRRYRDGSNDSAVSFKTPSYINPNEAAYKVKSHEMEHVRHEQEEAKQKGEKVLSQYVKIETAICPECGRMYVSGGTTTTITKNMPKVPQKIIDLFKANKTSQQEY